MSAKIIDARGQACPQPVILTKKALKEPAFDVITIIVDNDTALKNVTLLAEKQGAMYTSESREDGHYITLSRTPSSGSPGKVQASGAATGGPEPAGVPFPGHDRIDDPTSVLVVSSAVMGRGDDELGELLLRGFFHALVEADTKPGTIVFYNSGARLAAEGSPVLDDLTELEKYGVTLLACGTCLEYFGLKDSRTVGSVTNMYTITETLLEAERVINL
ncbi:MAG: sulfurtransferase-like selenium metabolism protein YedF [Spirochaetia bacterium]